MCLTQYRNSLASPTEYSTLPSSSLTAGGGFCHCSQVSYIVPEELGRPVLPLAEPAEVGRVNRARLVSCAAAGREVTVEVEVAGPRWLGQAADLRARARAGPVGLGPR